MRVGLISASLVIGCSFAGLVLAALIAALFVKIRGGFGDMSGGAVGPMIMLALVGAGGAFIGAFVGAALAISNVVRARNSLKKPRLS